MNDHEQWIREQGFGELLDNPPDFLTECPCDGDNIDEVCPSCTHQRECTEWLRPLTEGLERFAEIGEV